MWRWTLDAPQVCKSIYALHLPPLPLQLFILSHAHQLYPFPHHNLIPFCPHHFFLWGADSFLFTTFLLFVLLLAMNPWLLPSVLELLLTRLVPLCSCLLAFL